MVLTDEIVEGAKGGDSDAVELIYQVLAPRVVGYLTMRGVEDPEALTHDVFLAVLPRLPRLHGGEEGLRRFVFDVAHKRYVDEVRRRARRPAHASYDPEADPRVHDAADVAAIELVSLTEVQRHLRRLTPDQLAVVSMRVMGDLSLAQTAEVLGRSVGAVKQLQRRALESLRVMLEEGDAHDG